ncbi:MAG: hypothetical protein GXO43_04935 [Crenarchaeota archaeon]|nr:hypothetical protein [Thermoproteota archaeon]
MIRAKKAKPRDVIDAARVLRSEGKPFAKTILVLSKFATNTNTDDYFMILSAYRFYKSGDHYRGDEIIRKLTIIDKKSKDYFTTSHAPLDTVIMAIDRMLDFVTPLTMFGLSNNVPTVDTVPTPDGRILASGWRIPYRLSKAASIALAHGLEKVGEDLWKITEALLENNPDAVHDTVLKIGRALDTIGSSTIVTDFLIEELEDLGYKDLASSLQAEKKPGGLRYGSSIMSKLQAILQMTKEYPLPSPEDTDLVAKVPLKRIPHLPEITTHFSDDPNEIITLIEQTFPQVMDELIPMGFWTAESARYERGILPDPVSITAWTIAALRSNEIPSAFTLKIIDNGKVSIGVTYWTKDDKPYYIQIYPELEYTERKWSWKDSLHPQAMKKIIIESPEPTF